MRGSGRKAPAFFEDHAPSSQSQSKTSLAGMAGTSPQQAGHQQQLAEAGHGSLVSMGEPTAAIGWHVPLSATEYSFERVSTRIQGIVGEELCRQVSMWLDKSEFMQ